jgi:Uma2 family endonuclease
VLTVRDFQALPWPEGIRYELDEGEIVSTPRPAPFYNIVAGEIYTILSSFAEDRRLGCVFPSLTGYVLAQDKAPRYAVRTSRS